MTFLVNRVANAFVWTSVATAPKIAETDPMSMDARRHLNQVNLLSRCRKSWIVVGTSNPNAEEPTTNSIARNINAMESSNVQKGTTKRIVPI